MARVMEAQFTRAVSFSGPLPPPEVLREYNAIMPGLADRIVTMAETQSRHRMALEKNAIESDVSRANKGLWAGVAVAVLFAISGFILILTNHDTAGATVSTGTVATLAGVFVYGTVSRHRERTHKAKVLTGEAQE